jgi:uncharacterized protein (TIGR00369 family)
MASLPLARARQSIASKTHRCPDQVRHDRWRNGASLYIISIIVTAGAFMTARPPLKVEYGVTPTEVMASMAGIDFLRAMFAGQLPAPPIMQNVEPFDYSVEPGVVSFSSLPGFRHYNPIGSVHGGYAATLLDSPMGLAVHSMLPVGSGYTTLEFKVSFIRGMTKDTGVVRTEGRTLNVGRRAATAEARISDAKGRLLAHATTTCLVFEIPGPPAREM